MNKVSLVCNTGNQKFDVICLTGIGLLRYVSLRRVMSLLFPSNRMKKVSIGNEIRVIGNERDKILQSPVTRVAAVLF